MDKTRDEGLIGPFTIDLKVAFGDGKSVATVTYGLPPGRVPTLEDIQGAIGGCLRAIPDGYALLDGDDFFNKVLVKEKTGRTGNFAVPAAFDYDTEALARAALALAPEPTEPPDPDDEDEDEWDEDDGEDAL